ncbi:hypothetical protein [Clostridium sp. Marseille-P299]|uniref:hypothetical protein n=1 Tax=Clostridium sp. Marseille-P299 TaxID=1805477 RepID=UPI00082F3D7E|nr:hypothetical protein [Clostridium sp. Marseille-P299]
MSKNPILYKLISKKRVNEGIYVIGVYGIHRYVGVTHLTLLLAFYLADICGYSVVVIEASGKDDLGSLAEKYQVKLESKNNKKFSFHNIMFVRQATEKDIGAYRNSKYEFCILDLGGNYKNAAIELLRCDLKIVIGNPAPWHADAWRRFEEVLRGIKDLGSWCVIHNLSTKKMKAKITKLSKYYAIGLEPNLLHPSKEAIKVFQKIMQYK